MMTATEQRLRKGALVLTALVLLQVLWSGARLLLVSEPEPIVPAEASLQVDDIRYGMGRDEELSRDLVSRPLFWAGRQAYTPPAGPVESKAEKTRASAAIDKIELLGVYTAADQPGIIVSYKGERRRLRPDESIEDWKFTKLNANAATFASGREQRVLILEHAVPEAGAQGQPAPPAVAAGSASPPQGATGKNDKKNDKKGE